MTAQTLLRFTEDELDISLPARFRSVVEQLPADHLAYVGDDGTLTYRELDRHSDRIASRLVAHFGSGRPDDDPQPVVLFLPHGAAALIGILGALKAGRFFLPIDPEVDESVTRRMLSHCRPAAFVTASTLKDTARRLVDLGADLPLWCVDEDPDAEAPAFDPPAIGHRDWCCVYFTSGTTGTPLGIIRTHGQHLATAWEAYGSGGFTQYDRVAFFLSCAFSSSSVPIYGGLLNGATLCGRSPKGMTSADLYAWVRRLKVSTLGASVGMLRELAYYAEGLEPLPDLRSIETGGEVLQVRESELLHRLLPPDARLYLRLGCSEAGTIARFTVDPKRPWQGSGTPAGYPPPHAQVFCVDEEGNPVPPGEAGQICVRTRFLSAGYWHQPEKTAKRFLPDPDGGDRGIFLTGDRGRFSEDGFLEFLGRVDLMLKVRGYRVEPEAVETALMAHPAIVECAAVGRPGPDGETTLVAYLVPRQLPGPGIRELRNWLAQSQPSHMIPDRFVMLARMPRGETGKINRKALPEPGRQRPDLSVAYAAPTTPFELELAAIWGAVLGLENVGANDDFLELGGHSLAAVRILSHVHQTFGVELQMSELLDTSTVGAMARLLSERCATEADGDELADLLDELDASEGVR